MSLPSKFKLSWHNSFLSRALKAAGALCLLSAAACSGADARAASAYQEVEEDAAELDESDIEETEDDSATNETQEADQEQGENTELGELSLNDADLRSTNVACESDTLTACKIYLPEHNGVTSCIDGLQLCEDGAWSECLVEAAMALRIEDQAL